MKLCTPLALAASLAVATTASADLLVNPGFELDDTTMETPSALGWTTFNGVFTNQALANSGANGLKMFGGVAGAFQDFPVIPGDRVDGGAVVANPSFDAMANDQIAAINLEFRNAAGDLIDGIISNIVLDATSPADSVFVPGTVSAVAPDGAVSVRFVLVTGSFEDRNGDQVVTGGGAPFYDDAFLFINVPEPTTAGLLGVAGLAALRRRRRA